MSTRIDFVMFMLSYSLAAIYLSIYSIWKTEMGYSSPIGDIPIHQIIVLSFVGSLTLKLLNTTRIKNFFDKRPELVVAIGSPLIVIVSMTAFTLTDLFIKNF